MFCWLGSSFTTDSLTKHAVIRGVAGFLVAQKPPFLLKKWVELIMCSAVNACAIAHGWLQETSIDQSIDSSLIMS